MMCTDGSVLLKNYLYLTFLQEVAAAGSALLRCCSLSYIHPLVVRRMQREKYVLVTLEALLKAPAPPPPTLLSLSRLRCYEI